MKTNMPRTILRTCCLFAVITLAQSSRADLNVNGTDNGSWSDTATMIYSSAASDPTTVSLSQPEIGFGTTAGNTASLTMNSGTLTITSTTWDCYVGRQGGNGNLPDAGDGELTVNGGSLTWNATGANSPQFGIGNHSATGTVNMNGGVFTLNTTTFIVGRDAAGVGRLDLTGGLLVSDATTFGLGTGGNGPDSLTSGQVTFGLGNGILDLDNLSTLTIGTYGGANYFNFVSGSDGELEINDYNSSQFDSLIAAGDILINGETAVDSQFDIGTSGSLGTIQLAPAPEPSSLAMIGCGALSLLVFSRRRK
jgi:hypothetical protein